MATKQEISDMVKYEKRPFRDGVFIVWDKHLFSFPILGMQSDELILRLRDALEAAYIGGYDDGLNDDERRAIRGY